MELLYCKGITVAQNSSVVFTVFWMLCLLQALTQLLHLQSANKYFCLALKYNLPTIIIGVFLISVYIHYQKPILQSITSLDF